MRILLALLITATAPVFGFGSGVNSGFGSGVDSTNSLEGNWRTADDAKLIPIAEFHGLVTLNTISYHNNGASVNWFFQFSLPSPQRDLAPGEILSGRVRSVDSYYNCVFDEPAQAQLQKDGVLKIHFPLLTYHRETRSVRERRRGYYERRTIDWDGWGWVETRYSFPIDRYRVLNSQCVIDQRHWVTRVLTKTQGSF